MIIGLLIALTPVLAHADKSFNDGKGGTFDCKADDSVTINGNSATYTLKGPCKVVTVNGNQNKLAIEKVDILTLNGNTNTTTADAVNQVVSANGNDNKVTYKAGEPTVSSAGKGTRSRARRRSRRSNRHPTKVARVRTTCAP